MAGQLKKTLELVISGKTIPIDVDFRVIEVVERVYGANADLVASVDLANPIRVQRYKVANVIANWLSALNTGLNRDEIKEAVVTASIEELTKFTGAIQAAILFSLKYIDDEQFAALARGDDLPDAPPVKDDSSGKDDAGGA